MQTFDARLRPCCFWGAAWLPPVLFFGLVQVWSARVGDAPPAAQVVGVIALAQTVPVAALAWMLSSVAGYSVGGGQLVVHRVVFDRVYSLNGVRGVPQLRHGVITLVIRERELRLRVADPQACLAALRRTVAVEPQGARSACG